MIYEFVDKFLMNNLSKEVSKILLNMNKETDLKFLILVVLKEIFQEN